MELTGKASQKGGRWMTRHDVFRALLCFTKDLAERTRLRALLRECPWDRAWQWGYVAWLRGCGAREFSEFLRGIV